MVVKYLRQENPSWESRSFPEAQECLLFLKYFFRWNRKLKLQFPTAGSDTLVQKVFKQVQLTTALRLRLPGWEWTWLESRGLRWGGVGSGAPAVAWGEGRDRTHPRPGPRNWGLRGTGVAAWVEGEACPTRTRDDGEASAGLPAAGGGARPPSPPRSAGFLGSRSHPDSLDRPRRREGAGGPKTMGRGRGSKAPLHPACPAPRGGAAAEERPRDAAPCGPAGAGRGGGGSVGSGRTGRRRALTLTKSSMMGSLSSSFNPFSGIDNAMTGSAGLRGRRLLFLLRDCSGYGLPPRCSTLGCPGV